MKKLNLSSEQSEQIESKIADTVCSIDQVKSASVIFQQQLLQEAVATVCAIESDADEYQNKLIQCAKDREPIIKGLQKGIASGDLTFTKELLDLLKAQEEI